MNNGRLRNPAFFVGVALMIFECTSVLPQAAALKPAIPLDPIDGVLAAFRTHQVVTLGEGGHNNEQTHALRMSLIRDPRFAKVANDIVVEFGNSRYLDIMDRYVGGEDVPHAKLQQVWQNTTQAHEIWDVPIYEEFFQEVRKVDVRRSGVHADADWTHEAQRGAECRFGRREVAGVLLEVARRDVRKSNRETRAELPRVPRN
jgi:hypothetical protein